ncbi:hypothetical protein IFM89_012016 [Coptis chinensis]|uniref:SKP1-like protein n=1 Tax=Coptis chinensis TaxID=261450 RepID=A0A835MEY4_9MAGN|nr:hypothetical protein IFM89_012016 [Coptis chinensis]
MSTRRKVTLKSSDGKVFEVEEDVIIQSQTIKHLIEDDCADDGISLANVTGEILDKVIVYCKQHAECKKNAEKSGYKDNEELKKEDHCKNHERFMKVDQETLYDLISASSYLNIKSLMNICCQKVADMIKGKNWTRFVRR